MREVEAKNKAKAKAKWGVEVVEQGQKKMLRSVEGMSKQKGQVEGEQLTCEHCVT